MNRQIGTNGSNQPHEAQILDEHRIDAGRRDLPHELLDLRQLAGEHERVERDIAFQAAAVQLGHQRRQIGHVKILGAGAGVEARIEAEIDGVRAVFDRGANAVPVAGRGEEFGRE